MRSQRDDSLKYVHAKPAEITWTIFFCSLVCSRWSCFGAKVTAEINKAKCDKDSCFQHCVINKHLVEWNFFVRTVSEKREKKRTAFLSTAPTRFFTTTPSLRATAKNWRKEATFEQWIAFHRISKQFLIVVTPLRRHCSVNVLATCFAIKKSIEWIHEKGSTS